MTKETADKVVAETRDSLRARGYSDAQIDKILSFVGILTTVLSITGAPLADTLFPPALHVAADVLTKKQLIDGTPDTIN